MRLDAVVADVAFCLGLAILLYTYAHAAQPVYTGMAACWLKAEMAAADLEAGRRPAVDGYIIVRLISKSNVTEYTIGEPREGMECYTFRLLENGTLLYVRVRG